MDGRRARRPVSEHPALVVPIAIALAIVGGVSLVAVHPLAPIALVLVAVCGVVLVRSSFAMTLAFVAVLFVRPAELFPPLKALQLGKLVALGALFMLVAHKLLHQDMSWARLPHNRWLLWLSAAVVTSIFLGAGPAYSLQVFQAVYVKILVLWLLLANLIDSPKRAIQHQLWLSILAAVIASIAIMYVLQGSANVVSGRVATVGLLGDPNDLALTLLVPAAFIVAALLETRGGTRLFFATLFGLVLTAILHTQSRGGLLGLFVGIGLVLWSRVKTPRARVAVVLVAALGLLVALGTVHRADLSNDGGLDQSAEYRLTAWRAGAFMLRAHPVFGVGYEQFPFQFLNYADTATDRALMAAHNTFVKCFAETGLFGFVPFMLLMLTSLRSAVRCYRHALTLGPGLERALLLSQPGNLVAVMVSAFFLSQTWLWFIYIAFAGPALTARVYRLDSED